MTNKKIDKNKILAKIDEIDSYLEEIEQIRPSYLEEYEKSIEKKRAIERLLQISIESIVDISYIKKTMCHHTLKCVVCERHLFLGCSGITAHLSVRFYQIPDIITSNLKLGIPSDEDKLFEGLNKKKIISDELIAILKKMKGFRNILVHKYGKVDNEEVFENLENLKDFEKFKEEILKFLKNN